jgi:hypothetical protein
MATPMDFFDLIENQYFTQFYPNFKGKAGHDIFERYLSGMRQPHFMKRFILTVNNYHGHVTHAPSADDSARERYILGRIQ